MGYALLQSQFQADVQIDIVVDYQGTNREDANQRTEARAFRHAGTAAVEHRLNHRKHLYRHEHGGHAVRHDALDAFLGAVDGRDVEQDSLFC